jgi:hypothetical protein
MNPTERQIGIAVAYLEATIRYLEEKAPENKAPAKVRMAAIIEITELKIVIRFLKGLKP